MGTRQQLLNHILKKRKAAPFGARLVLAVLISNHGHAVVGGVRSGLHKNKGHSVVEGSGVDGRGYFQYQIFACPITLHNQNLFVDSLIKRSVVWNKDFHGRTEPRFGLNHKSNFRRLVATATDGLSEADGNFTTFVVVDYSIHLDSPG